MSISDAVLLAMQAPKGIPRSTVFDVVSDPLLPPSQTTQMLAHFYDQVYDLRPESHISRLMKVILGDTGTGQLRKRYTYAHLSQFLLTSHYDDLDQLYGSVFGFKRLFQERININVYTDTATDREWEAIDAADASYRSRIEAFSHSIAMAGTPDGMVMAANAVLGSECRVYESYPYMDDVSAPAPTLTTVIYDWSDIEQFSYGDLNGRTYSSMEGSRTWHGGVRLQNSRSEFVVRPLRSITDEERYHLTKVLSRIKPAESLLSIDARPGEAYVSVPVARAVATSSYWHIQAKVQIEPENADKYARYQEGVAVEQPHAAFSSYQGEQWSYNSDVIAATSSVQDGDGNEIQPMNFERHTDSDNKTYTYTPDLALLDPGKILMARAVSDGVLTAPVVSTGGQG